MRKLLFIIFLAIGFTSFGQGNWTLSAARNRWGAGVGYGFKDTASFTNSSDTNIITLQYPGVYCFRHLTTDNWQIFATSTTLGAYLKISDTSAMLAPYLRKTDTSYMLSKYLRKSDTASMLSGYARTGNIAQYWQRSNNTLSPVNTNDSISIPTTQIRARSGHFGNFQSNAYNYPSVKINLTDSLDAGVEVYAAAHTSSPYGTEANYQLSILHMPDGRDGGKAAVFAARMGTLGTNWSVMSNIHTTQRVAGVNTDKYFYTFLPGYGANIFPASEDTALFAGDKILKVFGAIQTTGSIVASSDISSTGVISGTTLAAAANANISGTVYAGAYSSVGTAAINGEVSSNSDISVFKSGSNTFGNGAYISLNNKMIQQLDATNGKQTWYNNGITQTVISSLAPSGQFSVTGAAYATNGKLIGASDTASQLAPYLRGYSLTSGRVTISNADGRTLNTSGNGSLNGNITFDTDGLLTVNTLTANTAINGILSTAAQPNITSLGTLTSLSVNGITKTAGLQLNGGTATFNYYQEGTVTVTLTSGTGSITLDNSTLSYTREGNRIFLNGRISVSSVSSPTGELRLNGLPFTVKNAQSGYSAVAIRATGLTSGTAFTGYANANTTYCVLEEVISGNVADLAAKVQAGTSFIVNIQYQIN